MYDEHGHFFAKVDVGCSSLLKIFLCKDSKDNEKLLNDNRQKNPTSHVHNSNSTLHDSQEINNKKML